MKKTKPSLEKYFKLPNPGLRAYFKHTESGNSEDYRPPFWKDLSREAVLENWQRILDQLGVQKKFPSLYSYELEMKAKVGPMSIQLPLKERLPKIEEYFTLVENPGEPISEEAIADTIDFFSKAGGIRLRSEERTIANMRLNTNSGTPYFTKRKRVADKVSLLDAEKYEFAAVLGWRGQEGGISEDDVKQRVIWMSPFLLNIQELRWYQPFVEAIQKHGLIPAYVSMDAVDLEVTALFDSKSPNDYVICTDFTAFDQHFNEHMQQAAKKVELALCADERTRAHIEKYFDYKFNIPLICSDEIMYSGPHGMGSGSGGTNFDECMAHKALQFEAARKDNVKLNPHSMAYGDDGCLVGPSVETVIQTYRSHGQDMNDQKQYVSKHDCVVLRRWHGDDYRVNGVMVGVYSTFRALGRLLAQERFYDPDKWSGELVTLRALSILENCKWSPYFHEFIDFVMTGDKYKLGLNLPGFFERLEKLAQSAIEEFTDFLGYTKNLQEDAKQTTTGIMNWEVVKYLMSKR
nr:MAG: putative RNA-dependent RNA polymerase [Picobirnavirus sp.]